MEEKVQKIIEKVRPYVNMHGGDVSLTKIEDGIVKLKVSGACAHCHLSHMTYNEMLGSMIKEEMPDIKGIEIEN